MLNSWVHDPKDNQHVAFNHARWPGVTEGEMISVTANGGNESFFFIVPKDDGSNKPQLQVRTVFMNSVSYLDSSIDLSTQTAGRILWREEQW